MATSGTGSDLVLVVDADVPGRRAAAAALRRVGFAVRIAPTAKRALQEAARERPCCVLVDVELPDLNGYEVCRALKETHGADLPVIFLSGRRTAAIDRAIGVLLGADDYVSKPFDPDQLASQVSAVTRRSKTPR